MKSKKQQIQEPLQIQEETIFNEFLKQETQALQEAFKEKRQISAKEIKNEEIIFNEPVQQVTQETQEVVKPKRQISELQLTNLAKAREKAKERKKELAQLNAKSKGLKEQELRKNAERYDEILKEIERLKKEEEKREKQKELEETLQKIEKERAPVEKSKKKIKKIIYKSDSDDDEEEEVVIVKQKAKSQPKQQSYTELANMSVEKQIKDRLQQEKIECFFQQLTGKKY